MDGRWHSVDAPISRALIALQRVRFLRDPSTNSMSKFSAIVDDLKWETNSSNAFTPGFKNACKGNVPNCDDVLCLDESRMYAKNELNVSDHELYYSTSRKSSSRLITCEKLKDSVGNTGSNAHLLNQGTVCENELQNERYCRDYEDK